MPKITPKLRDGLRKMKRTLTPASERELAVVGRPDGTITGSKDNYIWVTLKGNGQAIEVLSRRNAVGRGSLVWVGYDPLEFPKTKQVLGFADAYPDAAWMGPDVPIHFQSTHGFGKPDQADILRQQILYAVPVPGQNKIDIYPDTKQLSDGTWWLTTIATRFDFSASIPTTGAAVGIIVLDASGTVTIRVGTPIAGTKYDLVAADFPTLTAGDAAFVGIRLYAGMTEAKHTYGNDDLIDLSQAGAGAGNNSGITGLSGDVTASGPGVAAATIAAGVVTNTKLADMPAYTVKGNITDTDATPDDLTATELLTMGLGVFGGAQEVVNESANGVRTTFTFTDAALDIWVLVDGVVQKSADVTFTTGTTSFDLAFAPQTGADVRVVRLAPVTPVSISYPKTATMWHDQSKVIAGNALTITQDGNQRYSFYAYQNASSVNDIFDNGFVITAGTYTISALGLADSNCGKPEVFIDGVSIGTMDFYAAGTTYNTKKSITSVTLTTGYHKLEMKCNAKNVSSSGYNLPLTKFMVEPAAF